MPKAGEKVDPDEATIYIYVSLGPEPKVLTMENLVDLSVDAAKKYLIGQGVEDSRIIVREEYSEDVAEGKVLRTDPANGLTIQDSKPVTLYVSLGPEIQKVKMPNVVGWSFEDAKDILVDKGFDPMRITPIYVESNEPENEVLSQSVEQGMEVNISTEIILEVSSEPAQPSTTTSPSVPPTTVPPTTTPPAMPEVVSKSVTITIQNPPDVDYTLSLAEGGDFAVSDLPMAAGTAAVTVTLEGYGIQYFEVWIDGIYTEQVVRVDFTA
jgi:beta-lactam-binding protein with PASTA domain